MTIQIPKGLINILREVQHVVVSTGAGISAESGIPTFREAQTGLWAQYNPEELATPQAFRRNPKLVWDWYSWRRGLVSKASPNAGHRALAKMETFVPKMTLITQNVDGFHVQAGSKNVVHLHGNIQRAICFDNGHPAEHWVDDGETVPRCPLCNSYLRPDVVWFGESLPQLALSQAFSAAKGCDIMFVIGSSSLVQPAASLPVQALNAGIPVVEINPNDTPLTPVASLSLKGSAGEILPAILQTVWG